ncbi:hypothetical protein LQ327_01740 [Actinomycetospora endophytica]|uniref:Uncharacterized protein n=1 Tax=Actinomycetospora endophytica TaxID=2291215 RepID=A0ABS8P4X6_9PSEU|nr:hypothetical protein [Actinomycetospora endophytica]MCD2192114.1 hypothetical protein [Actinomycetospora endophytica]
MNISSADRLASFSLVDDRLVERVLREVDAHDPGHRGEQALEARPAQVAVVGGPGELVGLVDEHRDAGEELHRVPGAADGLELLGHRGDLVADDLTRQLRGQAGTRQVPGAGRALAVNSGGWMGDDYATSVATLLTTAG